MPAQTTPSTNRPNILLIVTDQQCTDAMSCAGHPHVATPGMDRIAASGVRFNRAYCSQPLCVPSRMSFMTGRMPREVGAEINYKPRPGAARAPMLGGLLRDAGYACGYVGKWHLTLPEEEQDVHGFEWFAPPVARNRDEAMPGACAAFFEVARRQGKPFFLPVMLINPHDICEWARGDPLPRGAIGEAPDPERCPPLPANHEPPADEPSVLRQVVQPQDPPAYPTAHWGAGKWRQYVWAYHRLVEKVDREVARILDELDRSGLAGNTVVIFTSDHGDGAAAHRWNQKQALFEECVRVPFIVSDPRQKVGPGHLPKVNDGHLVSLGLDLLPTVCDYAGAESPAGLAGQSLRPLIEGMPAEWRDCLFVDTEFGPFGRSMGVRGRMARTERFKYVIYDAGDHREQLFDLERDPGEMRNLVGDPMHRGVLEDHRRRLAAWCRQTGDAFAAQLQGHRRD